MRKTLAALLVFLGLAILPQVAQAQCSGPSGVPFNCVAGGTPQAGDYLLGGSNTAPQAGHTVRWTIGQILGAGTMPATLTGATVNGPIDGTISQVGPTIVTTAVCDGVTDATASLQASANAIPANGGTLLIRGGSGNCMISAPITIKSNTHIVGAGATIQNLPPASWSGGVGSALLISGATNITIEKMNFVYQHGSYGGGSAHIISNISGSNIIVRNNVSDGGGDFIANVGATNVSMDNNTVTNIDNSCFDSWGGSSRIRVTNNVCTTVSTATSGVGGIMFTGLNTDLTPATTTDFLASGNTVVINTANAQGIEINGASSGGADSQITVANNRIFLNAYSWGILMTGVASHGVIHGNYIEGTVASYSAIQAGAATAGFTISNNVAYNVQASSNGVFANNGTGGMLANNVAYSSSSPLTAATGSGVVVYGNDTGTGTLALSNVNITSGTASFSAGVSTLTNFTAGWNAGGGSLINVNGAAGTINGIRLQSAGVARWQASMDATAQSGSNVGGNFHITAYSDAGSQLSVPITITRSTGAVAIGTSLTVGGGAILPVLSATSASLGGSALGAGACSTGTVTVTGATTSMVVRVTPVTYPGDGAVWEAYVSAADTVTLKVCAMVAMTPTASAYNVRVIQ